MISRVAEHCFWLARYLERADNTARVLEVNHTLLLDFHVPIKQQWRPLLIISGIHDYEEAPSAENVQEHMTWNRENPFSIASSLCWARENARIIREVISGEMWERMNYYHLWMQGETSREIYEGNRSEFYAQVRRINQLIHGIADSTMNHGEAWEFFKLGTYLERTNQTARTMDVKYHTLLPKVEDVGTPIDHAHWMAILMSCSGYEPFHKTYRLAGGDTGAAVAEFLIYDKLFPRSIRRCLMDCLEATAAAAGSRDGGTRSEPEQKIQELLNWLDSRSIPEVIREGLHECLTQVVDSVHTIGNSIHATFFAAEIPTLMRSPSQSQSQSQSQVGMSQTQG